MLKYDFIYKSNKFNVSYVRALYYAKTLITNKMNKESFIINCNTLLHVSNLLGHLQGELFVIVTLRLHFIISAVPACTAVQAGTADNSRLQKQRGTQSTAHSHSTIKCNLSVTITKSSP
jgi:hypothetical protein